MITHQVAMALCGGFIAAAVVGGAALTTPVVQGARTSNDERFVLKATTAACKSEAREKKIRWPASGKYVNDCVAKPVKLTPAELQKITDKRATVACKAEAKGKKVMWPASRKYVKNCITTALKEHPTMAMRRVLRSNSRTPRTSSTRMMVRVRAGCEVFRNAAAAIKLLYSATARTACNWRALKSGTLAGCMSIYTKNGIKIDNI